MSENCPICQTVLKDKPRNSSQPEGFAYECPRCGKFSLSHHTEAELRRIYIDAEANGEKEEKVAVLSHNIRKMQKRDSWSTLEDNLIRAILKRSLPTPLEQKDLLIRWVGDNIEAGGDYIKVNSFSIVAIIGARTLKEFYFILDHLKTEGLIQSETVVGGGNIDIVKVTLSFSGLEYYEELKRGDTDKRTSFMAMEFVPKEQTDEIHDSNNDGNTSVEWDVFICHASEDKEGLVRPLAISLKSRGLKVWYDEFTLTVGDSLRRSIDKGLANSRYGIVVISPNFLRKEWPKKELDGLVALEVNGRKVILPVWHQIDAIGVRKYSPILVDRVATSSEKGIEKVVEDILKALDISAIENSIPEYPKDMTDQSEVQLMARVIRNEIIKYLRPSWLRSKLLITELSKSFPKHSVVDELHRMKEDGLVSWDSESLEDNPRVSLTKTKS